jgi:hypothetical protein
MKKLALIFLSLMLSLTLCACNRAPLKDGAEKTDTNISQISQSGTTFKGVNIKVTKVTVEENGATLLVQWANNTDYKVMYGDMFHIEIQKDGKWVSRQKICGLAFDSIGYELKPGEKKEKTYNLTNLFDISERGKYRISTHCFVYNKENGEENTKCLLTAEFNVTHEESADPQQSVVPDYSGNSKVTIHFESGESCTFEGEKAVTLADILANLSYDRGLCKCLPEYKVDTEFGTGYGIRLDGEAYVRFNKAQARLTDSQIKAVTNIIDWAKEEFKITNTVSTKPKLG